MIITYDNKEKIAELYLHDFRIKEFKYNDFEKSITIIAISEYIKKEAYFKFKNILSCEITGEKSKGGIDILDWYELTDYKHPTDNPYYNDKYFDADYEKQYRNFKPVGMGLVKSSWDTIRIYCEKIEFEEKELSK